MVNILLDKSKKRSLDRLKRASEKSETKKVAFVSGKIMADGLVYVAPNLLSIARNSRKIRKAEKIPVFSATDFLFNEIVTTIFRGKASGDEYWKEIIESGYITDLYMTPGWKDSKGATSEHEAAQKKKLNIHY